MIVVNYFSTLLESFFGIYQNLDNISPVNVKNVNIICQKGKKNDNRGKTNIKIGMCPSERGNDEKAAWAFFSPPLKKNA